MHQIWSPEVLQIREIEKPVPKKDEVCMKIHSAAVTASDIFKREVRFN